MKRYIRAASQSVESTEITDKAIFKLFDELGIDNTRHRYELKAEKYERYERGRNYVKRFTCSGDYLAYFSMFLHTKPTAEGLSEYFDDFDEFKDLVEANPTVEDIKGYASSFWFGDGDDFIFYLKNLDNNKVLYEADYEDYDEYDEDEE